LSKAAAIVSGVLVDTGKSVLWARPAVASFDKSPFLAHEKSDSVGRISRRAIMPCLLLIIFLAFPRVALVLLFLFSNYLLRAYHGLLLPLLGFIFLPLTTLAYAWMANSGQPTTGVNLIILIVAVVIDLGGLGGGAYHRSRSWD
jgi:predicted MFS family arabinose efflux permease